jgi:SAM-dependent methyltransferase
MAGFKDHFSGHAASYAAARPTYPAALADWLAAIAPGRDLAFEAGCGSGQLSALLAARFARVIATDASAAQVANARPAPGLEYRVAPAEAAPLADASADLVVAAQAAHWFDLPAFHAEARRVLRPGGVVALVAYGVLDLPDAPEANAVVADFYRALAPHWPPERAHVEAGYRTLPFPFAEIDPPALAIELDWSEDALAAYVATWSATQALDRAEGQAAFAAFRERLRAAWPRQGPTRIRWPLAIRAGRI